MKRSNEVRPHHHPSTVESPQHRAMSRRRNVLAILLGCAFLSGCQSFAGTPLGLDDWFGPPDPEQVASLEASDQLDDRFDSDVVQADGDSSGWGRVTQSTNRLVNFVSGREQEDSSHAKELYREADAEFRRASELPKEDSASVFHDAAALFRRAGEAAPGAALQQDAMWMQGESLFFADKLTDAADVYQRLQSDFPRNRHVDRVAARLFSISRYWIDIDRANEGSWVSLDLFDDKRPTVDVGGHAIRVLDQIRFDDPTGRLADDATMAAAAEYIRQEKYAEADEFLTDLRESFPDSDHLFLAHMMGIRCKLEVYAGPDYSPLMLHEADKLVRQTRQRFPDKLRDPENAEMVARAASEISYLKAEKLFRRAQYRDKQHEYRAAATDYQSLLNDHSDTPFADQARARLEKISELPPTPVKRLGFLKKIFPDARSNKAPLEMVIPDSPTMLR